MRNLKADLKIGKREEVSTMNFLNNNTNIFGKLVQDEDNFANFDLVSEDKKFYVEHKYRGDIDFKNCRYDSLYFDKIKYDKYMKLKKEDHEIRAFIIWNCSGERMIWEFHEYGWENEKNECEFYFSEQLNQDRGKGFLQNTRMCNVFIEDIKPISHYLLK